MRALVATLLLALASAAHSAEERSYAILSLVGDQLTIVQRESTTGTRIDRNTRTPVPLGTDALDNKMVLAVDREIRRLAPKSPTVLLAARRADLFELQARTLDEQSGVQKLLHALRDVVARSNATHLVLLTKHRSRARLEVPDGALGDGQLEGLGFYVDPNRPMDTIMAGKRAEGFIGPYAYFMATLVELRTGKILAQAPAFESTTAASEKVLTPWQSLTPEQKADMLEKLIARGAARAVPKLMAAR